MEVSERGRRSPVLLTAGVEQAQVPAKPRRLRVLGASDGDAALRRMLAAGDAISAVLALAAAMALAGQSGLAHRMLWGLLAPALIVVLFKMYGLYDRDVKRISYSTVDDLPRVFHALVIGTLLLWLYAKVTPMHRLDFEEILLFSVLMLLLTMSVRGLTRSFQARLVGQEPVLLIGGGRLAELLSAKLAAHPEFRSHVIGVLADGDYKSSSVNPIRVLGSIEQLERIVAEHGVRRVIVSPGQMYDQLQLEELLRRCRQLNLKFSLLPKLSDMLGSAVEIDDVEGVTVLGVNPPWLPRSSRAIKRVTDLLLASTLLLLLAPLIVIVALATKLDSRGPVFFSQTRVGRDGRRFRLYKFRTMVADAEQRHTELLEQSTDPDWLKLEHDPRITRLGRHLRRSSLDELPQLWNVLRGEMSMVGPRPLIPVEDERVHDWARGRLNLTPGISGYWQVLGRSRIPFEEMVKLDYLYVMNWSLWEDLRLMLRTLPAVLGRRGAN